MSVANGFRLSDNSTAKLDWNYVTKPDGTRSIIEEVNDLKQDLSNMFSLNGDTSYAEPIPENSDLNNYTTIGNYKISSSTVGATIANMPTGIATGGRLLVIGAVGASVNVQIYITTSGRVFIRRYSSGWYAWSEIITDSSTVVQNIETELDYINKAIDNYSCNNLFDNIPDNTATGGGVTMTHHKGDVTFSGTSNDVTNLNLYNTTFPNWLEAGKTYNVTYNPTNNILLQIYAYNANNSTRVIHQSF